MNTPIGFKPRLVEVLRDYSGERFTKDALAGVTVGIVALPLAMAFAIVSGVKPEAGIFTAVVADGMIDDRHDSNQELVAHKAWLIWSAPSSEAIRPPAPSRERPPTSKTATALPWRGLSMRRFSC